MKNLANCKPSEFLRQTNRIKNAVEKWLTDTDILNIRKNVAKADKPVAEMTDEEKQDFKKRSREQARANASKMLDAILDKHPDETLELLALLCFVEPENVDDYPMEEYLNSLSELISNQAVIGFFLSLGQLGLMNTSAVSNQ